MSHVSRTINWFHNLSLTYDMPHNILPLDLWDLLHSPFRAMNGLVWYLTAFLTSTSVFSGNGEGTAAQYLLGLGIGDITGPVVETNMMVYFLPNVVKLIA